MNIAVITVLALVVALRFADRPARVYGVMAAAGAVAAVMAYYS